MKHSVTAPIAIPFVISALALMLTGCGEDDGTYGSDSNNQITISSFDSSYDTQAQKLAVARIDQTYRTGARQTTVSNVVRNYDKPVVNDLDKVILANRFEGTLENKNINVNGRIVTRPIYEKNSNQQLTFKTEYQAIPLSGIDRSSYISSNNTNGSRGIRTDLNNYPNIASNVSFPAGSVCYIPITTSEREFLAFNNKDESNNQTLEAWITAYEQRFTDNRPVTTTRYGVGIDNAQKAATVTIFAFGSDPMYSYSGVNYNNKIYNAQRIASDTTTPNMNSSTGVVDCTLVNDVAADFLAAQIKKYYE